MATLAKTLDAIASVSLVLPDCMNTVPESLCPRWNCREIEEAILSVLLATMLASLHLVLSGIPLLLLPCKGLKSHLALEIFISSLLQGN